MVIFKDGGVGRNLVKIDISPSPSKKKIANFRKLGGNFIRLYIFLQRWLHIHELLSKC